jgi:5-formyltetrahydrofolate cyclo-ligase
MSLSKTEIRKQMAARRGAADLQQVDEASTHIVRNFQTMDVFQKAHTIGLYMAIAGEVNLDELFPVCWDRGMRTCIPVFNARARTYEMAEITSETRCAVGHYGIREPVSPIACTIDHIDLIAVPGVAFDQQGHRLGRGGGYYDRLLDEFNGRATGVAFDFQLLPSVPVEQHDRPVDILVTETQVIKVS